MSLNDHWSEVVGRPWKLSDTACRRRPRRTPLVLAQGLSELEFHDADCVIYLRGIHRLGFGSESILRKHYEQYGDVEKMFFSNAHELPLGSKRTQVRVRPSSIALLLMARPAEAEKALAAGTVQIVKGVPISVRKFVNKDIRASVCGSRSIVSEQLGNKFDVESVPLGRDVFHEDDTAIETTSADGEGNVDDARSSSSSNADCAA
jgi:hypothetical protein